METILAFVLGMSSVVVIGLLILAVVGYFKAKKTEKKLDEFIVYQGNNVQNDTNNIWVKIQQMESEYQGGLASLEKDFKSELDSRLDKFENKIKTNKLPEFSDVLTKERLEASKRIMDKIE